MLHTKHPITNIAYAVMLNVLEYLQCTSSVTKTKNMNNVFNKNKLELHVHNATTDSDR